MSTEKPPAASDSSMEALTEDSSRVDAPTFEDFFRREHKGVLGLAFVLTGNQWVAEDTAQDAFTAAFRRWSSIAAYDSPQAWVRRVTCNQAVSTLRRRVREAKAMVRLAGRTAGYIELDESDDAFWQAVRRLPERQAQAVALYYVEQYSVADIADVLGCSEGTVKTHLSRGRQAIARELQLGGRRAMSDFESRAQKAAESVRSQIQDHASDADRSIKRAKRPRPTVVIPSTVVIVALVAAGLIAINRNDPSSNNGTPGGTPFQLAGQLKAFDKCDDALQYFQSQAPQYYINQLSRNGGVVAMSGSTSEKAADAPESTMAQDNSAETGVTATGTPTTFSSTNVQELGVDEPDTIKTDGNIIVTVNAGSVYILKANDGQPSVQAKIEHSDFPTANVLLSGSRLLLIGVDNYTSTSVIRTYDISDPTKPAVVGDLKFDGNIIDARMVGTQVRVATSFTPDPDIASPSFENGKLSQKSIDALPGQLDQVKLEQWTPQFSEFNAQNIKVDSGSLVDCSALSHPSSFSGLNTTALISFDINGMPEPRHSVGVIAEGEKMYATANTTYISSTQWEADATTPAEQTDIHKFATAANGTLAYEGSGTVDGTLLSSYSMSEYDNVLRVATTVSGSRGLINRRQVTEGIVTNLRDIDNKLVEVGKLTGLGKEENESITAVHFVGKRGYVSTARQTDPFFVVNLDNPVAPSLSGKLEIPGFSSYLEPLSDTLVLAVGQSSSFSGGGGVSSMPEPANPLIGPTVDDVAPWPSSSSTLQFSLFDVSNPAQPKRVGLLNYYGGQAGAQFDPHAFLYWQPRNLVIAPATIYDIDGLAQFSGLVLMQATGSDLVEVGRLADTEYKGQYNGFNVTRTLVINNNVYMLSNDNLQVDSLDTHKQVATLDLKA